MLKYIKNKNVTKDNINMLKLLYIIFLSFFVFQVSLLAFAKENKRDPFVPLVDKDGNIRKGGELFVETQEILPEIVLKGILWDEKSPLAVINGKVLSEGSPIPFEKGQKITKNIILKKINPESVILDYNEKEFIIPLRKKEKE
ncbi:MAG: hypothetical protein FJZ11_02680 [Candidatus Omnitrophica bacterium]|nr:hypothetical protein [Candidatus Omnitrophota bacterium]